MDKPSPLPLYSSRLTLRAFRLDDAPVFSAYRSDPEVARYQGWSAPFTLYQATSMIKALQAITPFHPGDGLQIAIERNDTSELIGDLFVLIKAEDSRQAEVGFTLAQKHQGQGYALEAVMRLFDFLFVDLNLHRVSAICDEQNLASARLLERLGMRREAHTVENYWLKGRWTSEFGYAILQREWLARRGLF